MVRPGKFFLALPLFILASWPAANVARADDLDVDARLSLSFGSDDDEDVNDVVFREYFGCSDPECSFLPYYRDYYGLSNDDLMFLFFVARRSNRPVDEVVRMYYYDCGRDENCLMANLSFDSALLFVDLPANYELSGPYLGPYRSYWGHHLHGYRFSHDEVRALLSLRIGVDYGGFGAGFVIGSGFASSPHRFLREHRDHLGHDGRNWRGERVASSATRAWTLPEAQRHAVHQERHERVIRHEPEFQQRHDRRTEEIRRNPVHLAPRTQPEPQPPHAEPHRPRTLPQPRHVEPHKPSPVPHHGPKLR